MPQDNNAPNQVILRAFSVEPLQQLTSLVTSFPMMLKERLRDSIVKDRIMPLKKPGIIRQGDLLSNFSIDGEVFFGTIMRIALGTNGQYIDSEAIEKKTIMPDDIKSEGDEPRTIFLSSFSICMNKRHLVTNLPQKLTIIRVDNYFNWLLKTKIISLIPCMKKFDNLKLTDIEKLVVKDPQTNEEITINNDSLSKLIKNSICEILGNILKDISSMKEMSLGNIISSSIILDIKQPTNMSDEDYQRTYGAFLKPISDLQYLTFFGKDGQKITGDELPLIKTVFIEHINDTRYQEQQIYIEMAKFLRELK